MIRVDIYKASDDRYIGFSVNGHAGFAKKGKDIVCAAVSFLVVNTVNSIEQLTDNKIKYEVESGEARFRFLSKPDEKGQILIDAFVLGVLSLYDEYEDKYIRLFFKEV